MYKKEIIESSSSRLAIWVFTNKKSTLFKMLFNFFGVALIQVQLNISGTFGLHYIV